MKDRFVHRLRKKAKKGMRGWPDATIALYGPDLDRASKVVVSIIPSEHANVGEMRKWHLDVGDVRNDPGIAEEMLAFMATHGVLSVVMTDRIIAARISRASTMRASGAPSATSGKDVTASRAS